MADVEIFLYRPDPWPSSPLPLSSRQTFATTLDPQQFAIGDQLGVTGPLLGAALPHDSDLLLVRWGGMEPGGSLEWELDGADGMDLSSIHHLSMRVGQQTVANMPIDMCSNDPMAVESAAVNIEISLEDAQGVLATAPPGPLIQQDRRVSFKHGEEQCLAAQYMRTLRVPMTAFCAEPGFDPSQVRFIRITLPDTPRPSALYLNTIEFTQSPTLDAGSACG